jgi:hypothetical protein
VTTLGSKAGYNTWYHHLNCNVGDLHRVSNSAVSVSVDEFDDELDDIFDDEFDDEVFVTTNPAMESLASINGEHQGGSCNDAENVPAQSSRYSMHESICVWMVD